MKTVLSNKTRSVSTRTLRQKRRSLGVCIVCGVEANGNTHCHEHKEKYRIMRQKRVNRRLAAGLCSKCEEPSVVGFTLCEYHRIYESKSHKTKRLKRLLNGLCTECAVPSKNRMCIDCRANFNDKAYELKRMTLIKYGGMCACCGVKDIRLLTIDHINGGGNKHRRMLGHSKIYRWLKQNRYPDGYQVLCWNCNLGKHLNHGICPHIDNFEVGQFRCDRGVEL